MKKRMRILVIGDARKDLGPLMREIETDDYEVQCRHVSTIAHLEEAVSQEFDVAICDTTVPEFDSISMLQTVRERNRELPTISITSKTGPAAAHEAQQLGVDDYVLQGELCRLGPAVRRELRRAESQTTRSHELRESEQRFALFLNNYPGPATSRSRTAP